MSRALAGCASLCALIAGCSDAAPEPTASMLSPILGGEVSGAEDNAVVRIISRQSPPYSDVACNGTLIAPNVLVTSLHCVSVFNVIGKLACRPDGSLMPPDTGEGWIGETLDPARIEVTFGLDVPSSPAAFGLRVFGSGTVQACIDDIAFVVLDRALPTRGFPVRDQRPIVQGELMTLIGFGWSDVPDRLRGRRHQVPVIAVGPDDTSEALGIALPRSFLVGDGPCEGDGGGAALSEETGALTGIMALNFGGNCQVPGTRHSITKLAPYMRLLESAFAFAGETPVRESASARAAAPHNASGCALKTAAPGDESRSAWVGVASALALAFTRRRLGRTRGGGAR